MLPNRSTEPHHPSPLRSSISLVHMFGGPAKKKGETGPSDCALSDATEISATTVFGGFPRSHMHFEQHNGETYVDIQHPMAGEEGNNENQFSGEGYKRDLLHSEAAHEPLECHNAGENAGLVRLEQKLHLKAETDARDSGLVHMNHKALAGAKYENVENNGSMHMDHKALSETKYVIANNSGSMHVDHIALGEAKDENIIHCDSSEHRDDRKRKEKVAPPMSDKLLENQNKPAKRGNGETHVKSWTEDITVSDLEKNARVWCLISENEWTLGTIQSISGTDAYISFPESEHKKLGPVLRLPFSKLSPANPDILEKVEDLTQLSYLNEPAVLHNLRCRYDDENIYTRAGPLLIAINPFKRLPLYTKNALESYKNRTKEDITPHVYSTMASAYRAMMEDEVNQSIIISGESGAGKTETAKVAMQYLAAVGGGGGIAKEILQTNPILEAFGNAKTSRNDNSSRFGKLIDIYFEDSGRISGAKIQTYLLEKSRVVQKSEGERSYHIFYQLCAGADKTLRDDIHLYGAEDYNYLNQCACLHVDNVDDAANFLDVLRAMDEVKISKQEQHDIFAMLSAVLWLGNITFSVFDDENHVHADDNEALLYASNLLKCGKNQLLDVLSSRTIRAGNEDIVQKLTYSQAIDARDALAKSIYAGLFDWLIDRINTSFEVVKFCTDKCISILDIYGFESFLKNSFEQLCINYANERLQQYFNRHLFKLDQEEYTSEGVDWKNVEFEDNQECLDLFEKRPVGLISLLDEECTFPKGTDETFSHKLKGHLEGNLCFKSGRGRTFNVKHYAGEVSYDTSGFLEKNKDTLHIDLLQLLASCENILPQLIAVKIEQSLQKSICSGRRLGPESHKQSVGTKFKGQLFELMQRLDSTEPHFIRCIKPNTSQKPNFYQDNLVLQQLLCCGVLEVVRIARSGYPTRMTHLKFTNRYGFLVPQEDSSEKDVLKLCIGILNQFRISSEMYQMGHTKVFLRAGQIAILENRRLQIIRGIISFQKLYRGYLARCLFKKKKKAILTIQSWVRGKSVRKQYAIIRKRHYAAIALQRVVKGRAKQKSYLRIRENVIVIQKAIRGWLARKEYSQLQANARIEKLLSFNTSLGQSSVPASADQDLMDIKTVTEKEENTVRDVLESLCDYVVIADDEHKPLKLDSAMQTLADKKNIISHEVHESLRERMLLAEEELRQQKLENAKLHEKLTQYEVKWSEYETELSSLEEMWRMQMRSLQLSLSAAKQSLELQGSDVNQSKNDGMFTDRSKQRAAHHILPDDVEDDEEDEDDDFDWDDATSVGTAPDNEATTTLRNHLTLNLAAASSSTSSRQDGGNSIIANLTKEFEYRQQVFMDDAEFLKEVKAGQTEASLNPDEELQKLKQRFNLWKKDFKNRLRETKHFLQKLGAEESAQNMKLNWWRKKKPPQGLPLV